jgi:hypothetical protein
MATQMLVVIGGLTWGGWALDKWLDTKPLFVVIGSLLGVALAMYLVIYDFIPKNMNKCVLLFQCDNMRFACLPFLLLWKFLRC